MKGAMNTDGATNDPISDEKLMALADGELGAGEAEGLRVQIALDPDLAERFAAFAESRALLAPDQNAEAGDAGLAALAASIRAAAPRAPEPAAEPKTRRFAVVEGGGSGVRPAAPAVRPAPRFRVAFPALAASLALVVGGALGYAVGHRGTTKGTGGIVAVGGAPGAEGGLLAALENSRSGERVAWTDPGSGLKGAVALMSSHRLGDGRICREYEVAVDGRDAKAIGLGCRGEDGRWRTEIIARAAGGSGYGVASGGAGVVEGALADLGGGQLTEAEEQALLSRRWSPTPQ